MEDNKNEKTNSPSEEVKAWKKRNAWIVFWGIVACALIITIAYQ